MAKTITWNGITDGLVTIDTNVWVASMVSFYKVSDEVFTEQDFDVATFVCSNGAEYNVDSFDDYGDGVVVAKSRIISGNAGTYNKVSWNSYYITLPSDGTYFAVVNPSSDHIYVASATFPNATSETEPEQPEEPDPEPEPEPEEPEPEPDTPSASNIRIYNPPYIKLRD